MCIADASGGEAQFKGSHTKYDAAAEMVILNKIESQTDPETGKTLIDEMALKFEYINNNFFQIDTYQVASVYFSDSEDEYVFDYYLDGDTVAKIILYTKNGREINKQVYPLESRSEP